MLGRIYAIFFTASQPRVSARSRHARLEHRVAHRSDVRPCRLRFSGDGRDQYTVGVLQDDQRRSTRRRLTRFSETRYIEFVPIDGRGSRSVPQGRTPPGRSARRASTILRVTGLTRTRRKGYFVERLFAAGRRGRLAATSTSGRDPRATRFATSTGCCPAFSA